MDRGSDNGKPGTEHDKNIVMKHTYIVVVVDGEADGTYTLWGVLRFLSN